MATEGVAPRDVRGQAVRRTRTEVARRHPRVRVTAHACDVTDEDDLADLRTEVVAAHDTDCVHLVVNSAGIVGGGSFVAGDRPDWIGRSRPTGPARTCAHERSSRC